MIVALFFSACTKDDVALQNTEPQTHTSGMTQLGKKLHNPFTVQNMSKALANLTANARITEAHTIPQGVEYELLAECYIPDDLPETSNANAKVSEDIAEALIAEAFEITGNTLDKTQNTTNARIAAIKKWRPTGKIQVWDNVANRYVGVNDVLVKSRNWLTTKEGLTNIHGDFSCDGELRGSGQYSLKWEKYEFSVRSGTLGQAELGGPERTGSWNYNIGGSWNSTVNDTQMYYALIFQAARDYYYGNRFGLSSPPRNTTWHPQIKIAADISNRQNTKPSHAASYARIGGVFPTIYQRTYESSADIVYAVTTHELAHAAHWDMDRGAFAILVAGLAIGRNPAEAVIESWANGVEWKFANERYRNYLGIVNYEYEPVFFDNGTRIMNAGNSQLNSIESFPLYTSIVIDLIDTINQRTFFPNVTITGTLPNDNVSRYTIKQIEDGLRGCSSWNGWREAMRDKHENPTENNLQQLFNNWY